MDENALAQPRPQSSLESFDMTSAVKLVERTSRYRAWLQAFSCYADSGNWPGTRLALSYMYYQSSDSRRSFYFMPQRTFQEDKSVPGLLNYNNIAAYKANKTISGLARGVVRPC